jgi:hypothetical protein
MQEEQERKAGSQSQRQDIAKHNMANDKRFAIPRPNNDP